MDSSGFTSIGIRKWQQTFVSFRSQVKRSHWHDQSVAGRRQTRTAWQMRLQSRLHSPGSKLSFLSNKQTTHRRMQRRSQTHWIRRGRSPRPKILWTAVQAELGGAEYSFVQPDKRALPHNGDMIPQERRLAESMFRRDDGSSVIVATPTLAQGMNLPAQLAILAGDKRQDETGRSSLEAHEF